MKITNFQNYRSHSQSQWAAAADYLAGREGGSRKAG